VQECNPKAPNSHPHPFEPLNSTRTQIPEYNIFWHSQVSLAPEICNPRHETYSCFLGLLNYANCFCHTH